MIAWIALTVALVALTILTGIAVGLLLVARKAKPIVDSLKPFIGESLGVSKQ